MNNTHTLPYNHSLGGSGWWPRWVIGVSSGSVGGAETKRIPHSLTTLVHDSPHICSIVSLFFAQSIIFIMNTQYSTNEGGNCGGVGKV